MTEPQGPPAPEPAVKTYDDYPDTNDWLHALKIPAIPLAIMLALAAIMTVLLMVGVAMEDGHFGGEGPLVLFLLPFQLVAMGFFGPLRTLADGSEFGVSIVPLVLTAVFVWRTVRRASAAEARRPQASEANRVLLSLGSGAAVGLLVTVVAWILAIRSDGATLTAASLWSFLGGTAVAALAQWLGRHLAYRRANAPARPERDPANQPGVISGVALGLKHMAIFAVIAAPVALVWVMVETESFAPFFYGGAVLPSLLLHLYGLGLLTGTTASGGATADLDGTSAASSQSFYLWDVFSDRPVVVVLTLVAVIIATIIAAVLWHARRHGVTRPAEANSWAVLPVSFAIIGLMAIPFSIVGGAVGLVGQSTAGDTGMGATVILHLAFWSPIVWAIWGLIVEAAARYVAPAVDAALPDGMARRLLDLGPGRPRAAKPAAVETPEPAAAASTGGATRFNFDQEPLTTPGDGYPTGSFPAQQEYAPEGAYEPVADGETWHSQHEYELPEMYDPPATFEQTEAELQAEMQGLDPMADLDTVIDPDAQAQALQMSAQPSYAPDEVGYGEANYDATQQFPAGYAEADYADPDATQQFGQAGYPHDADPDATQVFQAPPPREPRRHTDD